MPDFQSLVERKLEPVGETGNDVIYRCPQCEGDSGSGHLYVNYNNGLYHCFKCGFRGRKIESLLRFLHIDIDYDYTKLYNEQMKELDNIIAPQNLSKGEKALDYSTNLEILTSYYNLHTKPIGDLAYQYLRGRGISDIQIENLQMKEGVNRYGEVLDVKGIQLLGRDYSGRIMVPSLRRDGLISFYVGRDFIGGREPRYLNPPKELAVASADVWNLDKVDSDSVIICEGVFTAIAASPLKMNAVATYGKSISHKANSKEIKTTSQGEKLLSRKFKNYYIAYDADALEESIDSCQYLYDRGANVYLVRIDPTKYGKKADVADIGYEEFLKLMREAIHYQGEITRLMLEF